jgi:hypothetical protein
VSCSRKKRKGLSPVTGRKKRLSPLTGRKERKRCLLYLEEKRDLFSPLAVRKENELYPVTGRKERIVSCNRKKKKIFSPVTGSKEMDCLLYQ